MNATQEKSKRWIWIVVIIAALLACCIIAVVAGGYFYLQSQGKTVEDALSGGLLEPQAGLPLPQTQEVPAGMPPDIPSTPTAAPELPGESLIRYRGGIWWYPLRMAYGACGRKRAKWSR